MTGKFKTRLFAVLLLVILVAGIRYLALGNNPGAASSGRIYAFDSFAEGTLLSIKVKARSKLEAQPAVEAARREVARLQAIFDPNDSTSEISRLNASRGSGLALELSPEMSRVLRASLRIRDYSGDAFEPSLGDLSNLWGFSSERHRNHPPETSVIRAMLDSTSLSREITLSDNDHRATLGPHTGSLDLGAIAKGYTVDMAVEALRLAGARDVLVDLGGEIGVLGVGSDGVCWRVGVQHPRRHDSHIGVLALNEGLAVATSGDYERFFVDGGRRYCHILDPASGYSPNNGVVSVTVVTVNCMEADAMATAAFILGPEKGIQLLEKDKCEGMIVYAPDGNTEGGKLAFSVTSGFAKYLPHPDLEGLPLP